MGRAREDRKKATSFEHIIPASYLRNFESTDGILYVYEQNRAVRESVVTRECAEHGFYEFDMIGRRSNNEYENWLATIEADGNRIVPLLCDRKALSSRDSYAWAIYVALLFLRTRKWRSQVSATMVRRMRELASRPEYIRDLQYEMLKRGKLYSADEVRHSIEEFQSAVESSKSFYHVIGLPRHAKRLANALLQMRWYTISITRNEDYFVTSDSPVLTVQRDSSGAWLEGAGFARENVVAFLPLTPRHVFAASAYFDFRQQADSVYVKHLNRTVVRFAHRNVYADRADDGLRQLVDAEINQVLFVQNAFRPIQD